MIETMKDTEMTNETEFMIETLRLLKSTDDEKLQSARDLALKYVRSPIPKTVLDIVERGAKNYADIGTERE